MKKELLAVFSIFMLSACSGKAAEPVISETETAALTVETSIAETTAINSDINVTSTEKTTTVTDSMTVSSSVVTEATEEIITTTISETTVSDESEVTSEISETTEAESPKDVKKVFPVVDKNWNTANMFKCGLVPVCTLTEPNDWGYRQPDKYGYADKDGNIVIQPVWDIAWEFSDIGIAVVGTETGDYEYKYGFIDTKGNILVEPQFDDVVAPNAIDSMQQITAFNNGYIAVVKRNEDYDPANTESHFYNYYKLYFVDPEGKRLTDDYDVFGDITLPRAAYSITAMQVLSQEFQKENM
ncbi:MAG: WG repeat-containing protein [Ruminococcus sp.]|uniref:WG repeat-containing protein n=1 Tax=Ruminococcus sp. TaxID=41978 RepID=UPI0025EAF9CC|nr:WG repeat-containing protein [Ruminococcus sp.]MCR5540632.1 WG repeat-containing protein [Ruminococcus sp.]